MVKMIEEKETRVLANGIFGVHDGHKSFVCLCLFLNPDMIITAFPKTSLGVVYLLGGVSLFNVFLAISIWMWKKIAIYGFYAVVIFGVLMNLYIGVGLIGSLSGLMGGIILFLVTKNKMQYFV